MKIFIFTIQKKMSNIKRKREPTEHLATPLEQLPYGLIVFER